MPEAEEDALPLKKRLGEFERLVYAGLVSSPLTGEKHTFDALYACAIAMNRTLFRAELTAQMSAANTALLTFSGCGTEQAGASYQQKICESALVGLAARVSFRGVHSGDERIGAGEKRRTV